MSPAGTARKQASTSERPEQNAFTTCLLERSACGGVAIPFAISQLPLSRMKRFASVRLSGDTIWMHALTAPADSPKQ